VKAFENTVSSFHIFVWWGGGCVTCLEKPNEHLLWKYN